MRFLFICGAGYVSGLERVVLNLMLGLREQGHSVACATSAWSDGDFEGRLRAAGIPHAPMRLGFISRTLSWSAVRMTLDQIIRLPGLWWDYTRYVRAVRPDMIVHTNFHHLSVLWPCVDRTRSCFHVHNGFPVAPFYAGLFRLYADRIRRFVAVSDSIQENLAALGVPPRRLSTVRNGIEAFPPAPPRDRARGVCTLGIVGQVGAWKGHDDLVAALALLREGGRDFRCLVFGKGDETYVAALRAQVAALGLRDRVEFRGFVTDVHAIFGELDVCVVPSRFAEPFGLVAAEAAMAGIPVVATARGGLREIVVEGETGFLVPAGAPADLAARLARLVDEPALATALGARGRDHANAHFGLARMARDFAAAVNPTPSPP